jgi:formylglycine-generating enzyme required for sulfatase activity
MLGKTPYYLISNINYYNNSQNIQSADVEINPNANGFRLPTEKEWEYASKAGTENKYSGCDSNGDIKKYAWFNGNSDKKTHPVKTKLPNEWGFYDMSGNVDELCWDKYESSYPYRVTRGGSWPFDALYLHSACRSYSTGRRDDIGFRVSSFL